MQNFRLCVGFWTTLLFSSLGGAKAGKESKKEEKKDKKEKKPAPKKEPEPEEELDAADAALAAEPKDKDPFAALPKGYLFRCT